MPAQDTTRPYSSAIQVSGGIRPSFIVLLGICCPMVYFERPIKFIIATLLAVEIAILWFLQQKNNFKEGALPVKEKMSVKLMECYREVRVWDSVIVKVGISLN